ncbi:MAG: hypothetical protein HY401_00480 [Elusimicrobia bacterium]|nr:hypothetical protein [Elusimicrobiota bacterium]
MIKILTVLLLSLGLTSARSEQTPPTEAGQSTEVVIKGEETKKVTSEKPPPDIPIDENEALEKTLRADDTLFLTKPFLLTGWKNTFPSSLFNPRLVQPWRTSISQALQFNLAERLARVVKVSRSKHMPILWTLTVVDQEGQVFQRFEGSGQPPSLLVWNGQNDRQEWVEAGQSYSTIFAFKDPIGVPYTDVGESLEILGFVHPGERGLHMSLDSKLLFGAQKDQTEVKFQGGKNLLRAAADFIKRSHYQLPLTVEAYAENMAIATKQAQALKSYLLEELVVPEGLIEAAPKIAPFAERHAEILIHTKN